MRLPRALTPVLALALLASGCTAMKFGSQRIEAGDASKVRTFCVLVAPQDKFPMDPALRETLETKFVPSITRNLKAKGYTPAPEESADVVVATHAMIGAASVDAIRWNQTVAAWYPWGPMSVGWYASSSIGKDVTFVVDVGDPRGQKLYWRSWAVGPVEVGAQHDPRKIDRLVDKVLSGVPKAKP